MLNGGGRLVFVESGCSPARTPHFKSRDDRSRRTRSASSQMTRTTSPAGRTALGRTSARRRRTKSSPEGARERYVGNDRVGTHVAGTRERILRIGDSARLKSLDGQRDAVHLTGISIVVADQQTGELACESVLLRIRCANIKAMRSKAREL